MAAREQTASVITAFVQIRVERGKVQQTAAALLNLVEVKEVYSVTGEYDLIAIVRVRHYEEMAQLVPDQIARVDGIALTRTQMAFQCYSRHDLERIWGIGLDDEAPAP